MASLMENLIDVLDKEGAEYEKLLRLSAEKTPVIIKGDMEQLQKITDEEQELVSRIANLDKKRAEVTADIANVLNKDVCAMKLPELISMLEKRPNEQKELARVYDRLREAVEGLRRVNEQNKELLADALEMISFEMNLLQATRTAPETANYNKDAYSLGSTMGSNFGGFDAKQ